MRVRTLYATMTVVKCIMFFCMFVEIYASNNHNEPIVAVNEGKLRGTVVRAVQGFPYYSFKGIPYARAPVGDLRFQAPLQPQAWKGIRDATKHGSVCAQHNVTFQGSEDCLFLNIYTRSLRSDANIPVMVFIHGGSFYAGSGNSDSFGPDFLIQHNVILVTMNYRQEVLGYLSLNIPEVSGNAGMKDQVAALKWIRDNIAQFGGDRNSVTIFGESSGASSVTYHMVSPISNGLFHRVIAQSGTCIQDWAIAKGTVERAFRAGQMLGKETDDVYKLLDFFKNLDTPALTNLTFGTLTYEEMYRGVPARFVPSVESEFDGIVPYINENPVSSLVKGKVNKAPLMIGYTSGEGLNLISFIADKLDVYNAVPSYFVQKEIADKVSEKQLEEFGDRIMKFYVGGRNLTSQDRSIIRDMQTDIQFSYNAHRFAHLYSGHDKVYFYLFNYETALNIVKLSLNITDLEGASHGDDLFYIFYNYLTRVPYENEELRSIVNKITKLWTDFAKTGSPTAIDGPGELWPPYTKTGREYFNIGEKWSVGHHADRSRMEFWDSIYFDAGVPHMGF